MNCPLRDEMRMEMIKIDDSFNDEQFFEIDNILFPHLWISLPDPDDEDYKEKWEDALEKRVSILHLVCNFVKKSKRFEGKDGD